MRLEFFIFLLFANVFSSIASLSLNGSITPSGSSDILILADFANSTGKEVYLNVTGNPQVVVKDKTGLVIQHRTAHSGNGTLIIATVPLDHLRYEITSDSFTGKEGSAWDFGLTLGSSENISSFTSTVVFPKGTVLKSTNGAVSTSDDALAVSWKASAIGSGKLAQIRAGYELEEVQEDNAAFALMAAAFLAAVIIAFFVFRPRPAEPAGRPAYEKPLQTPRTGKTIPALPEKTLESNPVFKTLDEVDKEIIREISRQGGKTTQAAIYLNTHIAKATLSRRLSSLEGRGIIRRSQKGNRNLVTLSEEMRK